MLRIDAVKSHLSLDLIPTGLPVHYSQSVIRITFVFLSVAASSRGRPVVQGPFQMYMKARQRSLSRDRSEKDQPRFTTRCVISY